MERLSQDEAGQLRDEILDKAPEHLKLGRAIISIGLYNIPEDPENHGVSITVYKAAEEFELRALVPLELQDNIVVKSIDERPRNHSGLSEIDKEALRRSVRDLSDIDPRTLERIDAGFARAYQIAEDIRTGRRNPMSGGM